MNYSNFKSIAKFTIIYGVLLIVVLVMIIFSMIEPYNKTWYLLVAGVLFAAYLVLLLIKPHFFGLNLNKNVIEVRFYNSHPFLSNYKQFKIPLSEYDGYELRKTLLGPRIVFKIKRGKQVGRYPALSLTAVPKRDLKDILEFLDNPKAKGNA